MPDLPDALVGDWIQSVVRRYERQLIAYASRHLNGDLDRARDVVQDTFLKLWQADRDQIDDHLAQWLYTVCRNRALDVRRKESRMAPLDSTPPPATTSSPHDDAVLAVTPGERLSEQLLNALTDRQQEVVRLKFQGGLSYREIAAVMDTTVNNVGVLLHHAIRSIRRTLDDGATRASVSTTGRETR